MADQTWKTGITQIAPNLVSVRGYALDELIGEVPYSSVVFLLLRGEMPSAEQAAVIDGILVSSVDHGASPPSTLAARTVASTGASLSASVAAGILSINQHHGGAVEGCMELLGQGVARMHSTVDQLRSAEAVAAELVGEAKSSGVRLPGFGHRLHTRDPRSVRLLELADQQGVSGAAVALARAMAESLSASTGRQMPLNVDGAIAALLCDLGFDASSGNAFFMIARMPGLIAHVLEERRREKPMRVVHPQAHEYDGPAPRHLEKD